MRKAERKKRKIEENLVNWKIGPEVLRLKIMSGTSFPIILYIAYLS